MSIFEDEIRAGIKDFLDWKQDRECIVVFPIISDLHSNLSESDPRNCQKRVAVDHLEWLCRTAAEAHADFAADLGDDGFDVPLKTPEEGEALLKKMEQYAASSAVPYIHCVGNHDKFIGRLDNRFWGDWQQKISRGWNGFVFGADGSYGYYEVPGKGCRVFFLNTSDLPDQAGFSAAQLDFLNNGLGSMPETDTAIVLTHISPLNRARWKRYPVTGKSDRFPELTDILRGFVNAGGKLAGVFSGDSHFDYFDFEDGVNYFVTQGYGGIGPVSELPPQGRVFHQHSEQLGRTDTFDSTEFCLIDLAAVKTTVREVRIFRIGAGGFNFHRGAKY